ncbi:hypothetical protein KY362_01925 [Candidatus Woesearchaeota archaeon]|nr:hypothetical protein [Candidatus Woesearchaeota archaeon]
MKSRYYDSYPVWSVGIVLLLFLAIYLAGAYIMFRLHLIAGILYIVYLVLMEFFVYKEACPNCYYYGKMCFSGRGKWARLIYRKGDSKRFCEKEIKFKDFIPQVLVIAIPVIVGIALLISRGFHLLTLLALLYPFVNWFAINPIIYGKLACPHCRQGKKCCPALDFFSKKKK